MARRIKENQHWAGVCAGMAMALVYIELITDNITDNNTDAAPPGISRGGAKQAGRDALIGAPGLAIGAGGQGPGGGC